MSKIIIVAGIPAAGKTTWSRNFVENNDGWIRINRDDIRRMFGKYWVPDREKLVESSELAIAEQAIIYGYNIVIDDSNLNPKYITRWENFAKQYNYEIEYKRLDISLDEALKRDANRENPVGEETIRKFYEKYCN